MNAYLLKLAEKDSRIAFELAAERKLSLTHHGGMVWCAVDFPYFVSEVTGEPYNGDPAAAMRKVIVRALRKLEATKPATVGKQK